MIRFIDLFSGIGGFRLGLEQTRKYECVWSCDNNKYANQIYVKHFGGENHYSDDVRGVNPEKIPNFDLLCAGFPCKTFSNAGQGKGFEDTRGTLFFEICRITEAKRPSLLFLENVTGLLYHDRGRTFAIILKSLEELGYWWEYQILNSLNFGVPQNRERVFIIGHLRDTSIRPIFPIFESGEIPNVWIPEEQIASTLQSPEHASGNYRGMNMIIADRTRTLAGKGRNLESPKPYTNTLTGIQKDNYLMNEKGIRRLTPLEQERLQGFPDDWTKGISETQRYKTTANAVTINVIKFLGERIYDSWC